jgi:hypothetical protein
LARVLVPKEAPAGGASPHSPLREER